MTATTFISATGPVRPTLQDTTGVRWSDDTLLGFLTDFVRLVQTMFTEVRRNAQGGIDPIRATNLVGADTIPLSDDWIQPLGAEYVLYRAFASDSKDEGNRARAAVHLASLQSTLPTVRG